MISPAELGSRGANALRRRWSEAENEQNREERIGADDCSFGARRLGDRAFDLGEPLFRIRDPRHIRLDRDRPCDQSVQESSPRAPLQRSEEAQAQVENIKKSTAQKKFIPYLLEVFKHNGIQVEKNDVIDKFNDFC